MQNAEREASRILSMMRCRCQCQYAVVLALILGCGSSSTELKRSEVRGTVKRAGVPVKEGSIRFLPADGHDGPAANGAIKDGAYAFTSENGPTAGAHQVVITILPSKDELMKIKAGPDNQGPKTKWEYDVTVPDEDVFEKDFKLDG